LIKEHKLPRTVVSLLCELLHLPQPRDLILKGILVNENQIELLGLPNIRPITMDEVIAVKNAFDKNVDR
jgi:hypothetical protein